MLFNRLSQSCLHLLCLLLQGQLKLDTCVSGHVQLALQQFDLRLKVSHDSYLCLKSNYLSLQTLILDGNAAHFSMIRSLLEALRLID